jgi:hypothetical protein
MILATFSTFLSKFLRLFLAKHRHFVPFCASICSTFPEFSSPQNSLLVAKKPYFRQFLVQKICYFTTFLTL